VGRLLSIACVFFGPSFLVRCRWACIGYGIKILLIGALPPNCKRFWTEHLSFYGGVEVFFRRRTEDHLLLFSSYLWNGLPLSPVSSLSCASLFTAKWLVRCITFPFSFLDCSVPSAHRRHRCGALFSPLARFFGFSSFSAAIVIVRSAG